MSCSLDLAIQLGNLHIFYYKLNVFQYSAIKYPHSWCEEILLLFIFLWSREYLTKCRTSYLQGILSPKNLLLLEENSEMDVSYKIFPFL